MEARHLTNADHKKKAGHLESMMGLLAPRVTGGKTQGWEVDQERKQKTN